MLTGPAADNQITPSQLVDRAARVGVRSEGASGRLVEDVIRIVPGSRIVFRPRRRIALLERLLGAFLRLILFGSGPLRIPASPAPTASRRLTKRDCNATEGSRLPAMHAIHSRGSRREFLFCTL
jgi:hypothetical protein